MALFGFGFCLKLVSLKNFPNILVIHSGGSNETRQFGVHFLWIADRPPLSLTLLHFHSTRFIFGASENVTGYSPLPNCEFPPTRKLQSFSISREFVTYVVCNPFCDLSLNVSRESRMSSIWSSFNVDQTGFKEKNLFYTKHVDVSVLMDMLTHGLIYSKSVWALT